MSTPLNIFLCNLPLFHKHYSNEKPFRASLRKCVDSLADGIHFLDEGFKLAVEDHRKKFDNRSMPEEKLKSANWNTVKFQTLQQQAQLLKGPYEEQLSYLKPILESLYVTPKIFHVKLVMYTKLLAHFKGLLSYWHRLVQRKSADL